MAGVEVGPKFVESLAVRRVARVEGEEEIEEEAGGIHAVVGGAAGISRAG